MATIGQQLGRSWAAWARPRPDYGPRRVMPMLLANRFFRGAGSTAIPPATFTGMQTQPAVIPPATAVSVRNLIDAANHTNPAVTLTIATEFSFDGGTNWRRFGSTTRPGGTVLGDDGLPETRIYEEIPIPVGAQVRSVVIVTGGSFVSAGGSISVA